MNKTLTYCLILAYLISFTFLGFYLNDYQLLGTEEARFQFIYMQNLAEGNGLVLDVGEAPFLGFNSLLWVLVGSIFFIFTKNIEICLLSFNLLLLSYSLLKISVLINKLTFSSSQKPVFLFFALLAVTPSFCDWNMLSLQEYGLWTSLILLLFAEVFEIDSGKGIRSQFGILLILLTLTHTAGLYWGIFFLFAAVGMHYKRESSWIEAFKIVQNSALTFIITQILLYCWQLWYFGARSADFIDLKSIFERFLHVLFLNTSLILYNISLLFLLLLSLYYYFKKIKRLKQSHYVIDLACFTFVFYIFQTFFISTDLTYLSASAQFYLPVFYLGLICLLIELPAPLIRKRILPVVLLFTCFVSAYNYLENYLPGNNPDRNLWQSSVSGTENGQKMNDFFDLQLPLPASFTYNKGAMAYSYNGECIDAKFSSNSGAAKNLFFAKLPDVLCLHTHFFTKTNSKKQLVFHQKDHLSHSLFNLLVKDKRFALNYKWATIRKKNTNLRFQAYISKQFLVNLDSRFYSY